MKWKPIGLLLFTVVAGLSCQGVKQDGPLAGEWRVSLSAEHQKDGVIVFDPEIPCYCAEDDRLPSGTEIGRAYLDLTVIGRTTRNMSAENFAMGEDADYYEEVFGAVEGSAVVINSRGPAGPRLEGIMEGDSIRGTWMYTLHGDTLHSGHFVMNRIRASEYTDSARVRSHRGVDEWIHEPALIPGQPVDTAPPAQEIKP